MTHDSSNKAAGGVRLHLTARATSNTQGHAMTAVEQPEEWRKLLEESSYEVFDLMLGSKLDPGSDNASQKPTLNICSMVGLAGGISGVVSVRCSTKCGILIASKLLALEGESAEGQVPDAMGEIANMIAGNFKTKIPGMADGCMLSVPTVINGKEFVVHSLADGNCIDVYLEFSSFPFWVSLYYQPTQ